MIAQTLDLIQDLENLNGTYSKAQREAIASLVYAVANDTTFVKSFNVAVASLADDEDGEKWVKLMKNL